MGAYSEIDLERQISGNPFEESGNIPECVGTEPGAAEPQPQEETSHVSPESAPQTNPSADDTANEDEKKKAHEEAEAKRKADFDARQAAKKAAEQEQLDRLAAMSDDEVMAASMKRVSTDTEKTGIRSRSSGSSGCVSRSWLRTNHPPAARRTTAPASNIRPSQPWERPSTEAISSPNVSALSATSRHRGVRLSD